MPNVNNSIDSEKCPLLKNGQGKGGGEGGDTNYDSFDSDDNTAATATIEVNSSNLQNKNGKKIVGGKQTNGFESGSSKSKASSTMKNSSSSASSSPVYTSTSVGGMKNFNKNFLEAQKSLQWQQDQFRAIRNRIWSWSMLKRKMLLALLGFALLVFFINSSILRGENDDRIPVLHYSHVPGMKGYLVWSERCKMPNIDPYLPEVMEYFERQKYQPCSLLEPLTHVVYDAETQRYILRIIKDRIGMFSKSGRVDCCYQSIERNGTGKTADSEVWHSKCISFRNETQLAPTIDNILVKCKATGKQVYINGHAMMPERKDIRDRINNWKSKDVDGQQNATSVLMIGIDSISRINLIRAMPKTAQYLYDNEWFEMSGYNKIDDNTFPNLMAVLIGQNKTNALKKCPPTVIKGLDNCPFIWNTFRDHGYVTAYAEDEASINTFNYLKVGFERPPVDYYLRPFLLSAEKHLPIRRKSNLIQCIGYQNSADYVYNYALELATRYKNDPYFGLFWMNTFSHNAISDCSAMDVHVEEYLKKLAALGTLNNTIVIFFSDHGLRFGPTRKTLSGHLEERLPFMFIWLPTHLKQSHPEFVNALSVNKNRLTNPYDLHMTLKHVLALSNRVTDQERLAPAEDCPRCQTLLAPVPHNRSCDDIAIVDHWCTCIPYQSVYKNSKNVQKMAQFTVDYINDFVSTFHNGSFAKICQPLHLANVDTAYRAQHSDNKVQDIYRINFYTAPNQGLFEATIRHNKVNGDMDITGEISRLNAYVKDSHCVSDGAAKKYCSCRKKQW